MAWQNLKAQSEILSNTMLVMNSLCNTTASFESSIPTKSVAALLLMDSYEGLIKWLDSKSSQSTADCDH